MTSRRPCSPTTRSYIAWTSDSSARSARIACPPTECSTLSTPTTTAPSLANRVATAWPITLAAPLTTQTLPTSTGSLQSLTALTERYVDPRRTHQGAYRRTRPTLADLLTVLGTKTPSHPECPEPREPA